MNTVDNPDALPGSPEPSPAETSTQPVGRILALDVGNRRIGLALSDPLGHTAQPLFTLHRSTPKSDLKSLARVVRKHGVTEVVIGDPLHASGELSPQALKTREFASMLRQQHPEMPVHLLDERFTTAEAHDLLDRTQHRGGRQDPKSARQQRTALVDQVAATLLLEAFLSIRSPRLLPEPPDP